MGVSIIICTYKREKFIKENIDILNKECKGFIDHVFIIDNSSSLPKELNSDFVSIIYNKNLGGSGGYARGLYEVKKNNFSSHIMLMDDDIVFKPSTLKKAIEKINNFSEEEKKDWIGFAMMKLNNPTIQFEMGARWNGIRMHNLNKNLDLSNPSDIQNNVPKQNYNYSAWWSLIMPISVIDDYGYPMPFFIKFDDIEYGLRRKGEKIILSNEYKIWHESFDIKFDPYLEYYLVRNSFITNALHFKNAKFLSSIRYLGKCTKYYFMGRFSAIKMANLGCKEYFIGPNLFLNDNAEDINQRIKKVSEGDISKIKSVITFPFITIFYLIKIFFKFNTIKKEYAKNYKYLTSEEYWIKQFGK